LFEITNVWEEEGVSLFFTLLPINDIVSTLARKANRGTFCLTFQQMFAFVSNIVVKSPLAKKCLFSDDKRSLFAQHMKQS